MLTVNGGVQVDYWLTENQPRFLIQTKDRVIPELVKTIWRENVLHKIEDLIVYSYDASVPLADQLPLCVVTPHNRD